MRHSNPVRLQTAPTGHDKSGSKPRGASVYLFLVFTISYICGEIDAGLEAWYNEFSFAQD